MGKIVVLYTPDPVSFPSEYIDFMWKNYSIEQRCLFLFCGLNKLDDAWQQVALFRALTQIRFPYDHNLLLNPPFGLCISLERENHLKEHYEFLYTKMTQFIRAYCTDEKKVPAILLVLKLIVDTVIWALGDRRFTSKRQKICSSEETY